VIVEPGVLVPARLAPAVARLIRAGWADLAARDGLEARLPPALAQVLEELDAVSSALRDPPHRADARGHD
jgi:hypothetical protein